MQASARVEEIKLRLTRIGAGIEAAPPPRTTALTMRGGGAHAARAIRRLTTTAHRWIATSCDSPLSAMAVNWGAPTDSIDTRLIEEMSHRLGAKSPETARRAQVVHRTMLADPYCRETSSTAFPRHRPIARHRPRRLRVEEAQTIIGAAFADDAAHGRSVMGPLVTLLARTGRRQ